MATREQIIAAHAKNPQATLYFDAKIGGVVVSSGQVTGHTYCQDRKKTTVSPESFRAKGVPDGSRGNEVYVQKARTGTVVSGYPPYSCPKWYEDARRQGVTDWDDSD
jgi:hypothetical protein